MRHGGSMVAMPAKMTLAAGVGTMVAGVIAGDFFTDPLPAGGGLLIAEKLMAEDRSGPVGTHMQSLNMLVCTEGRERTLGEYRVLLEEAGFGGVEGKKTGVLVDAVLAVK